MGCGGAQRRAPHTPKYLGFAYSLYNRAHFCKTIKTRGSNPIF